MKSPFARASASRFPVLGDHSTSTHQQRIRGQTCCHRFVHFGSVSPACPSKLAGWYVVATDLQCDQDSRSHKRRDHHKRCSAFVEHPWPMLWRYLLTDPPRSRNFWDTLVVLHWEPATKSSLILARWTVIPRRRQRRGQGGSTGMVTALLELTWQMGHHGRHASGKASHRFM